MTAAVVMEPSIDQSIMEELLILRERLASKFKGFPSGVCWTLAENVKKIFGFDIVPGLFIDDQGMGSNHYWNLTPNGTIIDLSADQFGNLPPIYVVGRDSPEAEARYIHYVSYMF